MNNYLFKSLNLFICMLILAFPCSNTDAETVDDLGAFGDQFKGREVLLTQLQVRANGNGGWRDRQGRLFNNRAEGGRTHLQ